MEKQVTKKKITLRDRKRAQPGAVIWFSEAEKATIYGMVSEKLDIPQKNVFFYQCQALGLNPLISEIAAVPYKDKFGKITLSIQVMRDGFLTIAHRSGKFAGLESGITMSKDGETIISGWAKVYHKDFTVPVHQEADFNEYNMPTKGGKSTLWATKPKTMIKKVAESMALRKAFNVSGAYAKEEMEKEIEVMSAPTKVLEIENGDKPADETQIATIQSLDPKRPKSVLKKFTKQEASELINELSKQK